MSNNWTAYLLYLMPLAYFLIKYLRSKQKRQEEHVQILQESVDSGMTEPPSLHPVVNPNRCIGSGSCVKACPEEAIGLIGGKAVLINPTACIGHGACLAACPVEAISLVFGTVRRGIDIPHVKPNFETNIDGIFIAGELGGMGLIRKAAEQGRQAMEAIKAHKSGDANLDVVIVGAGPAGISAGLGAIEHKLNYQLIEQEDSLGGSVYHYPRNKIAMTAPVKLPLIGNVKMGEISKEKLLDFWHGIVKKTGLKISFNERMESIMRSGEKFIVKTSRSEYEARTVLLAIGRRGSPRKLDVEGEELAKVVYRLIDPEQYRGQHVLVVGGGDSALEAAIALAEQPGTTVALSYRGDAFNRVKEKNRQRLQQMQQENQIRVLLQSQIRVIHKTEVILQHDLAEGDEMITLQNDATIICAGGVLPTPLLQKIGVMFETKRGTS